MPEASKNTDNGATPLWRLETLVSVMAPVAPNVKQPTITGTVLGDEDAVEVVQVKV